MPGHTRFDVRRYPVWRAPYRRRWLVLLTAVATPIVLTVWLTQLPAESTTAAAPGALSTTTTAIPNSTATADPATPDATAGGNPGAGDDDGDGSGDGDGDEPGLPLVTHAAGEGKVVSLTFDDGPDPRHTPRVLDLLARHGATATFCMVGTQALRHPDLVRRVVDAGMPLCAHSLTHDDQIADRAAPVIDADVTGSRAILVAAAGADVAVEWYRAPAGNWSRGITDAAARHGMRPLSWSVDSLDWQRPDAEAMATAVRDAIEPGAVVLFHDGGGDRGATIAVLETLLPWLVEQGYAFVPPA